MVLGVSLWANLDEKFADKLQTMIDSQHVQINVVLVIFRWRSVSHIRSKEGIGFAVKRSEIGDVTPFEFRSGIKTSP